MAKTIRYLNDTNTAYVQVVEERDENGVLQARYDNGDGDTQKLYRRRESDGLYLTRWYLNDGLESTRQLVDANGVVTDSYGYDAFGSTLQRAGETENTRLYNGQQQDESGLYFLRARYYNSGNGRFLNHDPLLGNSDDPVTLHRYLYANADPVDFIDPSGRMGMISQFGAMSVGMKVFTVGVGTVAVGALTYAGAAFGHMAWVNYNYGYGLSSEDLSDPGKPFKAKIEEAARATRLKPEFIAAVLNNELDDLDAGDKGGDLYQFNVLGKGSIGIAQVTYGTALLVHSNWSKKTFKEHALNPEKAVLLCAEILRYIADNASKNSKFKKVKPKGPGNVAHVDQFKQNGDAWSDPMHVIIAQEYTQTPWLFQADTDDPTIGVQRERPEAEQYGWNALSRMDRFKGKFQQ